MVSRLGSFVSYQVNVDASGNNIIGDAANECTISVDPTNLSRMAIGWRQFDDVTSNFRQAGNGYTTDSGLTWTFPGVLQPGFFRSDPVTASDETGTFFYLSLRSSWPVQTFFCDDMWRSTNGGATWDLISGKQGAIGGDKQWFTIDKTGGPGHHFQYQSFDQSNCAGGLFNRSSDAGVTWETPVDIPNEPIFGTLDVALGHYRRYSHQELRKKMEAVGFRVEKILEFNRVSRPGWYVSGKILKRTTLGPWQMKMFDQLVWLWRRIDRHLPWPPTSIIAIGVKM